MSAEASVAWRDGWTTEEPAEIGFAWASHDGENWGGVAEDGLRHRDLGLVEASDGTFGVELLRTAEGSAPREDWHADDLDFDFLFVLAGSVELETAEGVSIELGKWGCAVHKPGGGRRYSNYSGDFEAVRITAPAAYETAFGEGASFAPEGDVSQGDARKGVYSNDDFDNYELGNGPRKFFYYRDLGTSEQTGGRIHLHLVQATEPGAGTGWHYHSMAQWFMILRGTSTIAVEDHTYQPLVKGDAMCVGRGPRMRHNVAPFSRDYVVLEMCVPAVYETVPVDEPENALTTEPE